jgi:hypothetical protein
MTRDQALHAIAKLEAGLLSVSERQAVIDAIVLALLRAAVKRRVPIGAVTFDLKDVQWPVLER